MILYIESYKEYTHTRLLEITKKFRKIKGYKVNAQKSATFLYTVAMNSPKINNLLKITSKIIIYLIINLTKEVKDLYIKNYKTLKEIKACQSK